MLECPFCNKITLKVLHIPETFKYKRSHASSNTKTIPIKRPERYVLLVEECPNCHKSKTEIEEALKRGKEPSNEEVVRRLREAGLDVTKLK